MMVQNNYFYNGSNVSNVGTTMLAAPAAGAVLPLPLLLDVSILIQHSWEALNSGILIHGIDWRRCISCFPMVKKISIFLHSYKNVSTSIELTPIMSFSIR
jgi:hypothetical protein